MARIKPAPEPPPEPEPEDRVAIIHLKGSRAYAAWLESIHRKTYIPKTAIIRRALVEWAERHGHDAPPEL